MPIKTEQDVLRAGQELVFGPGGPGRGRDQVRWTVRAYANRSTSSLAVHPSDGDSKPRGGGGLSALVEDLKVATYVKGCGAWFSAELTFDARSGPGAVYDLVDDQPAAEGVLGEFPDAQDVWGELWRYPRTLGNIPQWALDRLAASGQDPIHLDPATDQLVWRAERDPYRQPGEPAPARPAPATPVTVTVAELGANAVRPGHDVEPPGPVVAALQRYARACADVVGADQILLRPPPAAEDLAAWRDSLGVEVPPELAELYSYANGEPEDFHTFSLGLFWMESVAQMAGVAQGVEQRWNALRLGNVVQAHEHDERMQPVLYHRGWIPFGTIDGNTLIAVDTVPTEHGRVGQVVAAGDHLVAPRVLAPSLAGYLDGQADLVEAGRCRLMDSHGNEYGVRDDRPSDDWYVVVPEERIVPAPEALSARGAVADAVETLGLRTTQDAEGGLRVHLTSTTTMSAVPSPEGVDVYHGQSDSPATNGTPYARFKRAEDAGTLLMLAAGAQHRLGASLEPGGPPGYPQALPGAFTVEQRDATATLRWTTGSGPVSSRDHRAQFLNSEDAIRFAQVAGTDPEAIARCARSVDGEPFFMPWVDRAAVRRVRGYPVHEQVRAILGDRTFRWACAQLRDDEAIDDFRFRDFINVTEEDIYQFALANGFDQWDDLRVAGPMLGEGTYICGLPGGRWTVFYTDRGEISQETSVSTLADARREVIRRMMDMARIELNHRFKSAHPELDLPRPSQMD